jgi:hypothetical protein
MKPLTKEPKQYDPNGYWCFTIGEMGSSSGLQHCTGKSWSIWWAEEQEKEL